jgi:membrane protease YdiL (CAAX protease family)
MVTVASRPTSPVAQFVAAEQNVIDPNFPHWGPVGGLAMWIVSVFIMAVGANLASVGWVVWRLVKSGKPLSKFSSESIAKMLPKGDAIPVDLVIFLLIATMVAQIVTLLVAYRFVGKPFFQRLGWHWHPRFRPPQAMLTTLGVLVIIVVLVNFLPQTPTSFEKLLRSSIYARIGTVILAIALAPLIEEVIYRGILFAGLYKKWGAEVAVIAVSTIFLMVHLPQYWGNWAIIGSLGTLSLAITLVRAYTGSILPCVVIHLLFNSVQSIIILAQGILQN